MTFVQNSLSSCTNPMQFWLNTVTTCLTSATISKVSDLGFIMVVYKNFFIIFKCLKENRKKYFYYVGENAISVEKICNYQSHPYLEWKSSNVVRNLVNYYEWQCASKCRSIYSTPLWLMHTFNILVGLTGWINLQNILSFTT